jgi:glyoxylase-like metal-dependent hydrolase (beta-lactamase superfamily II)
VRRCGVDPREIEWIVLSHFDPDHYGGLADFPNARVICARRAWQSVSALGGKPSLAHRILPGALPADLAARLWIVDPEDCFSPPPVEAIFGFSAHCDLFGDGSVRLVSLPGHKEGQIGAFVCAREKQPEEKKTYFLVGDGVWSRAELTCAQTKLRFGLHARLARDRQAQLETYRKIRYVHFTHPEVVVVPSHCPDTADALLADKQWRNEK